jgi:SAM-dependent methyltransferase
MRNHALEIMHRTDRAEQYLEDLGHTLTSHLRAELRKLPRTSDEWAAAQSERTVVVEKHLPSVTRELDTFFADLTELDRELTPDERKVTLSDFRARIQPFFFQSPFFRRAADKPCGYPGDYMTVEMLYDNKAAGETPLGELLARYGLDTGPARAHRARLPFVVNHLKNHPAPNAPTPEVLSFACGPERVLREYLASGGDCGITLADADDRALRYAKKKLEELERSLGRRPVVRSVHISALALIKGETGIEKLRRESAPGGCDVILVLGLLDYLGSEVAARFIENLTELLKPGGHCLLTNVHSENPWRSLMEYVADWFVFHRSKDELLQIATKSSGLVPLSVETDASGVNVFFTGRKD